MYMIIYMTSMSIANTVRQLCIAEHYIVPQFSSVVVVELPQAPEDDPQRR